MSDNNNQMGPLFDFLDALDETRERRKAQINDLGRSWSERHRAEGVEDVVEIVGGILKGINTLDRKMREARERRKASQDVCMENENTSSSDLNVDNLLGKIDALVRENKELKARIYDLVLFPQETSGREAP